MWRYYPGSSSLFILSHSLLLWKSISVGNLLHISLQLFVHPFLGVKKDSCESLFSMINFFWPKVKPSGSLSLMHGTLPPSDRVGLA